MARCKRCGSELELGQKECQFCFNPLTPQEIAQIEREHHQDAYFQKNAVKHHRNELKKKLLIIIPSVIVAIALITIFFGKGIVNLANKAINYIAVGEVTEEDVLDNIHAVALEALDYCSQYDISQTKYNNLNEYVTAITKEKLAVSYPGEFDDDHILIQTNGTLITRIEHNDYSYVRNGGYEIYNVDGKKK